MSRLTWAWWGLTGHAQRLYMDAQADAAEAYRMAASAYDLQRQLGFANAAIAHLKSRLTPDYEKQERAESDAISNKVIAELKAAQRRGE